MAEQLGIVQVPTGSAEIRDTWLQDVRLAAIDTGVEEPPIEPGTDLYIIGEANSQIALVGIANISIAAKDVNVLDATGDALDAIREGDGLPVVNPAGATGKIKVTVSGATTIANGTKLKLPNGLRIQTVGTFINPADQAEIDVAAIEDTGTLTNLKGGSAVQFVAAPTNVSKAAIVSSDFPLTGGTDKETDARKRDRILNTRRNKPAAGNWAYWRQFVLDNFAAAVDTYVYPALGGPSSHLIVPVRGFDRANNDYSRTPSSALVQAIRTSVQADANTGIETVVRGPANEAADFTLLVDIPDSVLAGGNGQGWTNTAPWPSLEVADADKVTITAVGADNDQLTLSANTATAPIEGQTEIAWWSSADRMFYTALVIDVTVATPGAWGISLDRPLVGIDGVGPQVGDYVCPNAQNLTAYGDTWVSLFEAFGPGEMTTDTDRLPRSLRNPNAADEDPHSMTRATLKGVTGQHVEITDIAFGYSPLTSPTVPAGVDDPPNILVPRRFAVYPL
jgi:hypothetical protein